MLSILGMCTTRYHFTTIDTFFFIRTRKFWPSLIVLNFLGNSASIVLKLFLFLKVLVRTTTVRNNSLNIANIPNLGSSTDQAE